MSKLKINPSELLSVKIMNPNKILWEGEANSVSSKNASGPFDILPRHANFITLIKKKVPIIVRSVSEGEKEFSFDNAVMQVHGNNILIFTQIGSK